MTAERWLPIPGYEGHYEVSDAGRMRSLTRKVAHGRMGEQTVHGRLLSAGLDTKGYPRLMLQSSSGPRSWAVHRAVLVAFCPRPDWAQMQVNHKDGVRHNNRLENLEWCTSSENRLHAYRVLKRTPNGTGKFGALHHNAVAVVGRCISTGEIREYASMADVRRDGFSGSDVSACVLGAQKSHRGWLWRYASDSAPLSWEYRPADMSGANNVHAKPVEAVASDGSVRRYEAAVLARVDGFNPVCISHCLKGLQQTHRGYSWRYA